MTGASRRGGLSADRVVAFVLPVAAAVFLWQAALVTEPPRDVIVGPRLFPLIIGAVLLVLAFAHLLREYRRESRPAAAEPIGDWAAVGVLAGALAALILLFELLGFVVASFLFVAAVSTFLDRARWRRNVAVAVVFAPLMWALFTRLLGIDLPGGIAAGLLG